MQQLKEQIRALIMQNETDEAVNTLLNWSKSNYLSIYDQCVLLRARLEQIERETNTNLIAPEDAMRQVNQVNAALLNLLADLETPSVEQTKSPTPSPNTWLVPTLIGALILAVGAALYFFFASPTPTATINQGTDKTSPVGKISFPEGKRVVLVENAQEVTYEILDAKIEPLSPQQKRLTLRIRCSPKTAYGQAINFWVQNFRLECPGIPPLAPSNDLNLLAEGGSYQDGPLEFLLPVQSRSGKLTIRFGSQTAQLSLVW